MQQNFLTKLAEKIGLVVFGGTVNIEELRIVGQELSNKGERYRQIVLNKVDNYWLKGVLEKSLYKQVMIELGIEQQLKAVAFPWNLHLETGDELQQPLPQGTKIIDIFDNIGTGRTLLILGAPGSGKTITLLELTRNLIARAQQDVNHLIPVVFNLSSWKGEQRQTIAEWIVEELTTKYQIPKQFGEIWVKEYQLLLLLDGLDEVRRKYRGTCINALNRFLQDYGPEIVVCSRTEDYESLSERLALQSAVCIQPLTTEQINQYLDRLGNQLEALKKLLQEDTDLREFVKVPLILSVMILAYQDRSVEDLLQASSAEERQQCLFNAYIKRMFQRPRVSLEYPEIQVKRWLSWLAKMISKHQSLFLIEEIQPNWLLTSRQTCIYIFCSRLITGLIFVMPFSVIRVFEPTNIPVLIPTLLSALFSGTSISLIDGYFFNRRNQNGFLKYPHPNYWHLASTLMATELIFGLLFILTIKLPLGLIIGLPFGLFVGLLFGIRGMRQNINRDIKTFEILNWSGKNSIIWAFISLIIANVFAFFIGLIVPEHRTVLRLTLSLLFVSFATVVGGLRKADVETESKSVPNQGILYSCKSAALGAIIGGFIGVLVGISKGKNYIYEVETFLALGMSMGALWYGGYDVIKHLILRFILYCNGFIPWNYAQFLNYAAERIFLQKVGGGYIFIHRLLMEHFAQIKIDSDRDHPISAKTLNC